VFLSRGIRLPAGRVLVALLLLHLGLQHMRHEIVFAIAVPLLLAEPLARALASPPQRARPGTVVGFAMMAIAIGLVVGAGTLRLSLAVPRGGALVTPQAALDHVPPQLASQPVLNAYGFGGYLIFRGVRPFIDSRAELYGDDFLANYARIVAPETPALTATIGKYRVAWTIFPPDSPVVAVLDLLPGWHRLYADHIAVVHYHDANPKH
jgi:hypothetical protein